MSKVEISKKELTKELVRAMLKEMPKRTDIFEVAVNAVAQALIMGVCQAEDLAVKGQDGKKIDVKVVEKG